MGETQGSSGHRTVFSSRVTWMTGHQPPAARAMDTDVSRCLKPPLGLSVGVGVAGEGAAACEARVHVAAVAVDLRFRFRSVDQQGDNAQAVPHRRSPARLLDPTRNSWPLRVMPLLDSIPLAVVWEPGPAGRRFVVLERAVASTLRRRGE